METTVSTQEHCSQSRKEEPIFFKHKHSDCLIMIDLQEYEKSGNRNGVVISDTGDSSYRLGFYYEDWSLEFVPWYGQVTIESKEK